MSPDLRDLLVPPPPLPVPRPDGRIDVQVDVPIRPGTWVVQGVVLSKEYGLGYNEIPARVSIVANSA